MTGAAHRHVTAQSESGASQGKRVVAQDESVAVQGEHVAAQDAPIAARGEHVAAQDAPIAARGEHVAAQDAPVAAQGTRVVAQATRVAFQGERGAFSEEAALALLGERIDLVPTPSFPALFDAVRRGLADCVLAPIENSLAGSVDRSCDLLIDSELSITAEIVLPIAHCLIGVPGASLEQIERVESHPVALAQCERFFQAHPALARVAVDDTAGSVRTIVQAGDPSRAAIAGRRAAGVYGAAILAEHVEDHAQNFTRFLLLRPGSPRVAGANKLSLVVWLRHRPGALHEALGVFAARGIDLLAIESRPIHGQPWHYRFFLDLRASDEDDRVEAALDALRRSAEAVRVLGRYRSTSGPFAGDGRPSRDATSPQARAPERPPSAATCAPAPGRPAS